jgi:hypothetical protein
MTWAPSGLWSVPREWPGERCWILCGGESLRQQRHLVPTLPGRIIAIKEGVLLRPDADVLFLGGERTATIARPLIPKFRGTYMVLRRGRPVPELPASVKCVTRTKDHTKLAELPTHVCGYDSGTSAINLAYHFGATEIILLGYDMTGGRWFTGEWPHPEPTIPEDRHRRHMDPLPLLAADAAAKGIRIINCSPISRVECFERRSLREVL